MSQIFSQLMADAMQQLAEGFDEVARVEQLSNPMRRRLELPLLRQAQQRNLPSMIAALCDSDADLSELADFEELNPPSP